MLAASNINFVQLYQIEKLHVVVLWTQVTPTAVSNTLPNNIVSLLLFFCKGRPDMIAQRHNSSRNCLFFFPFIEVITAVCTKERKIQLRPMKSELLNPDSVSCIT